MTPAIRYLDRVVGSRVLQTLSLLKPVRHDASRPVPRRLLVIKLAAVGDTLLLMPVLSALRKALPQTEIDWLVSPVNKKIAAATDAINHFYTLNLRRPWTIPPLIHRLRGRTYDAVIDFEQWILATAWLTRLLEAGWTAGFDTPGTARGTSYTVSLRKRFDRHEIEDFFALAQCLVPLSKEQRWTLPEYPEAQAELQREAPELFTPGERRVLLHPGCGADGFPREWPEDQFIELGHWLQQRGATLYLSGGPEEKAKSARIARQLGPAVHDVSGRLSWLGMISLLKRMDIVVSGNTGVMHLAAALHRPQIALHGPTDPRLWGPLNECAQVIQTSCSDCPCLRLGFEYHRLDDDCMRKISVSEVEGAIERLTGKGVPKACN